MKQEQIILIALIILFGIFLVFILYSLISKISKNKKEKKIDKVYNPENLVEQNSLEELNKPVETPTNDEIQEKENKFFE